MMVTPSPSPVSPIVAAPNLTAILSFEPWFGGNCIEWKSDAKAVHGAKIGFFYAICLVFFHYWDKNPQLPAPVIEFNSMKSREKNVVIGFQVNNDMSLTGLNGPGFKKIELNSFDFIIWHLFEKLTWWAIMNTFNYYCTSMNTDLRQMFCQSWPFWITSDWNFFIYSLVKMIVSAFKMAVNHSNK